MMAKSGRVFARLLGSASAITLLSAGVAYAEPADFSIAPQPLAMALNAFSEQSGRAVLLKPELADALASRGVNGALEPEIALVEMLRGTGLTYRKTGDTFLIVQGGSADPQPASAAGGGAEVEALIVTAQKREENIQDVPIAISAFTQKDLEEQKIEGGYDLLKAIPNVTFSKNNFTSYNFSIRGIGTKAVSATTDPGVAVSFNNVALLQNRLFEQEYFDIERVEVLRGPQGTLYGRNATAGVINVITAKPDMNEFKGWIKGEVGNYDARRLSAMVNVPLVQDKVAIRFAAASTERQGYDFNIGTGNAVNGRDLWSARVTLAFNPTDRIRTNLVWERFEEDDNRSRTGKQLCHRSDPPLTIGTTTVAEPNPTNHPVVKDNNTLRSSIFSQGCKAGSLYDPMAFGTPNGLSLPFVIGALELGAYSSRYDPETGIIERPVRYADPYGGLMQSSDLRVIESLKDPAYRAGADVVELNIDFDISDQLTFVSQTLYNKDTTYSSQDYNRFNTQPIFNDTALWGEDNPNRFITPGGEFCDPQLGCSKSLVGYDIAQAKGSQFSQEIRLQSDFDGPINFSAGANYTRFKTTVDYYIFYNMISLVALTPTFNWSYQAGLDPLEVCTQLFASPTPAADLQCPYVDPNPLESVDGEGHNYFRSKNPYRLSSTAAFGELYWSPQEDLKVTAGLRYTDDSKTFIPVPSQILLSPGLLGGGDVPRGYPELPPIEQHWGEWTGRLGVDWQPESPWTDQTMVYAFYSHGYKGGGANPPSPGFSALSLTDYLPEIGTGLDSVEPEIREMIFAKFREPILSLPGEEYLPTFEPEFVDAFEVGSKNTLMGGALTFNANGFYYAYTDYQVSQIKNRTAVNENFDADVWGLEFETLFAPSRNLRLNGSFGYLDTKIASGERSIDTMNRTQSNPDWTVVKPWIQLPSNCIAPTSIVEKYLQTHPSSITGYSVLCGGSASLIDYFYYTYDAVTDNLVIDPMTGELYTPLAYPEANGGAGLYDDIGGNELPNAPHWTISLGAQYGFEFVEGWRATLRGDAYWQSQSWARVYNAVNDKLHGWYNANLSLWIENDDGLKIEIYAKNILDGQPITDAFINSDDTALTTNVFALDPRLIGLSIRQEF